MKSFSILYENPLSMKPMITDQVLSPSLPYLIRIFITRDITCNSGEQAVSIARDIQQQFPVASIIGCTVNSVIYDGENYCHKDLVVFDLFESSKVSCATLTCSGKSSKQIVDEFIAKVHPSHTNLVHLFCDHHVQGIDQFINDLNRLDHNIQLTGGLASNIIKDKETSFVFTPDGICENGMVFATIGGNHLSTYHGVNTSHRPISHLFHLTQAEKAIWKSVDYQPIHEWLLAMLGIDIETSHSPAQQQINSDIFWRFPLILEGYEASSRFLSYNKDLNAIAQCHSSTPVDTGFYIGYVDASDGVRQSLHICNEISQIPLDHLFIYSCFARSYALPNMVKLELLPYKHLHISGVLLDGEFAWITDHNEFLQGSCCSLGVGEGDNHLHPDIHIFHELSTVEDDAKELLNFVLKCQGQTINRNNEKLFDKLKVQQLQSKQSLFIDTHTGYENYIKYKEDRAVYHFNKLCMIRIENSTLLISHLGHDTYYHIFKHALDVFYNCISQHPAGDLVHFYVLHENSFFLTANESLEGNQFNELVKLLFDKFYFMHTNYSNDVLITRFAVSINQKDLVKTVLSHLHDEKYNQIPFLMCHTDGKPTDTSDKEFEVIRVLNYAIQNDLVIPYFQGIYDNNLGCIYKYEALMRVIDQNGTVYPPGYFMDVAKKYHLYSYLSKRMMTKVFSLFKGRKESVSLNFSALDINLPEIQTFIFECLQQIGDCSNFILEILEDEEFRDPQFLQEFLNKAKTYGMQIAIDDFGSGYSNLLEIARIQPDFLKVDGGIIKHIHQDELSRKILSVILYLSDSFQTKVIAEFVENEEIQKEVKKHGIDFSQGYYFSKPVPFEELDIKER